MIIAGTGHRPDKLGGYNTHAHSILVDIAIRGILELEEKYNTDIKVISGMALGWDMALAEAAVQLDKYFIAAVPFKGQEKMWPKESQDKYNSLLNTYAKVHIISEGEFSPVKMQIRNQWMVDNCDLVLAMYDGTKGGTHNCMQYAKKQNKPIVNLYEELYNWKG